MERTVSLFPKDGLNLDSGTTYYFEISNLTDTSSNQNPIVPDAVNYKTAESYGHKVPVIEMSIVEVSSWISGTLVAIPASSFLNTSSPLAFRRS